MHLASTLIIVQLGHTADLLYFRVAEVPKSQDLAFVFVDDDNDDNDNDDNDNDTTDYFTTCACARGNYSMHLALWRFAWEWEGLGWPQMRLCVHVCIHGMVLT